MKYNIKKEVNHSVLLMNDPNYQDSHITYYELDKIMAFGGDNFKSLCEKLNLKGERALVPTGSGDQSIELVHQGFNKIISYDINALARHILFLKIAAIKTLSFSEFIYFSQFLFSTTKGYELYQKCIPFLEEETVEYFNMLFTFKNPNRVYQDLFTHKCSGKFNLFLNKEKQNFSMYHEKSFLEIKRKLLSQSINYQNWNILDSDVLNQIEEESFDFIYLSNILLFAQIPLEQFVSELLPVLIRKLSSKGIIIYHYFHCFYNIELGPENIMWAKYQHINECIYRMLKDKSNIKIVLNQSGFGHGLGKNDFVLGLKK